MVNQKLKHLKKRFMLVLLAVFIFIVMYVASLYSPIFNGIASFPVKTVECGGYPYIGNRFAGLYTYTKPGDMLYKGPDIFTKSSDLYCTEKEAQKAGNEAVVWADECEYTEHTQPVQCTIGESALRATFIFILILGTFSGLMAYCLVTAIDRFKGRKNK